MNKVYINVALLGVIFSLCSSIMIFLQIQLAKGKNLQNHFLKSIPQLYYILLLPLPIGIYAGYRCFIFWFVEHRLNIYAIIGSFVIVCILDFVLLFVYDRKYLYQLCNSNQTNYKKANPFLICYVSVISAMTTIILIWSIYTIIVFDRGFGEFV